MVTNEGGLCIYMKTRLSNVIYILIGIPMTPISFGHPQESGLKLVAELEGRFRDYFLTNTADVRRGFTVIFEDQIDKHKRSQISSKACSSHLPYTIQAPSWRGSARERRLLEHLGLWEAAEAYHKGRSVDLSVSCRLSRSDLGYRPLNVCKMQI